MHLLMEFELNHEEIAQIISLQAELEAEFFRIPSITPPGYRNDFFSDIQEKISAVYSKARERSLKYYASHTAELITALKGETKNIIVCILEIEAEQRKPIEFWKERTISLLSPYLSLLDNAGREQIMRDIDYVFEHREEIYREAQRHKNQRGRTGYEKLLHGPGMDNGLLASKRRMTREELITSTGLESVGKQVIDGVFVELSNFDTLNITDSARKLFDILAIRLTKQVPYLATAEQILKGRRVSLTLDEYMSLCALTDRKEARKKLINSLETLSNIWLEWDEKSKIIDPQTGKRKYRKTHWKARLLDKRGIEESITDGGITVYFTVDIAQYLSQAYIMQINLQALAIDTNTYRHAYPLAIKLYAHYYQNAGKYKHIRISVESLIKACPEMPRPEEVKSRHYRQQIIDPFEKNMDVLQEAGIIKEWHYCNSGGEPLTDEQLRAYDFNDWLKWLVEYTLPEDCPEPQKRKTHRQKTKQPKLNNDTQPQAIALPAKTE